jgi:predicted transcriptional regulator
MDPARESGNAPFGRDVAPRWSFVTNHFLVLASIAGDPDLRVRDIAVRVGITERATQAILSDLVGDGYVERIRIGRRNRYKVRRSAGFRHAITSGTTVGEVLDVVLSHRDVSAVG